MNSISIAELVDEGYSEDVKGLKDFLRPYWPLAALIYIGLAAYIISFYLMVTKTTKAALISVGLAMLFLGALSVIGYLARPKSKLTGKPMLKYKNRFPDEDVVSEWIYVCPDSKTFFRRIHLRKRDVGDSGPVGI
ncbi:MAG: hypothetical protein ACXWIU_07290 [Limisphaerales bacterium]